MAHEWPRLEATLKTGQRVNYMARDNFPKRVIDKLRMRVANRCSNPDCRVPTTAPGSDEDKINNIGIAAHICAASPGGPRFSLTMTTQERTSIKNGIWLCSNCSSDIDNDEVKYTVPLLHEWKIKAEKTAREELGKKLPSNKDAIDTVSAALTGFPKSFLATAISNVHQASEKSLEQLDSRFVVKSSYSENKTRFEVFAKENVIISMNIKCDYAKEYSEKYKRLIEHGEDLEISAEAIKFDGSKLLEEISTTFKSPNGKFILSQQKKKGVLKISLVNKVNSVVEVFDDILGEIKVGNKSLIFNGSTCNGVLSFSCNKPFNNNDGVISFGMHFDNWKNHDIQTIPYLYKLLSLYDKMADDWEIYTILEIKGIRIFESIGLNVSKMEFITQTRSILHYIENISIISNYLNEPIFFNSDFSYTTEEFMQVLEIALIINDQYTYNKKNIPSNVECDLIVDKGAKNIDLLQSITEPAEITFVENYNTTIVCFGKALTLPRRVVSLNMVKPKISLVKQFYMEGDTFKIEWIPCTGFEFKIKYDKNANLTYDNIK